MRLARRVVAIQLLVITLCTAAPAALALPDVTERVSVASDGSQAQNGSLSAIPYISADGRYVAFTSSAKLVPQDTNDFQDMFVKDRHTGSATRVGTTSAGTQANSGTGGAGMTPDARYVVFISGASDLVPGDTNANNDAFIRDLQTGQVLRASVDSAGNQANGSSLATSVSSDGRYVGFYSDAANLVPGDTNSAPDAFVRDIQMGSTERVNVDSAESQTCCDSLAFGIFPILSGNGRYVAFSSAAVNLVPSDTNNAYDVFVRDRQLGTTERVSVDSLGSQANGASSPQGAYLPSISADGRYVVFTADASNLVAQSATRFGATAACEMPGSPPRRHEKTITIKGLTDGPTDRLTD